MKKDTILITGSSGFLGLWLRKKLNNDRYNIFLTASKNYPEQHIRKLDLTNYEETNKIINETKPSIIYHLGAIVDLSRDYNTAIKCIDINVKGTLNLLKSLKKYTLKKFILASTEEVYGNGPVPFKESQIPHPPSAYSISKIAAEDFCSIYAQELNFKLIIFRIATMYGPENPLKRFIPQTIIKALNNENIPLNSGLKKRDYIYVEDVANAFNDILATELKNQIEVFNLGYGQSHTLKYLVQKVIELTKSSSNVLYNAFPDRSLEAEEWLVDINKALTLLNWKPQINLDEGLAKTIKYFKASLI